VDEAGEVEPEAVDKAIDVGDGGDCTVGTEQADDCRRADVDGKLRAEGTDGRMEAERKIEREERKEGQDEAAKQKKREVETGKRKRKRTRRREERSGRQAWFRCCGCRTRPKWRSACGQRNP